MFIARELVVDAAFGAAQAGLVRVMDAGGLTRPSQVAYEGGLTRVIRVGPFGDTPGVSKLVQVRFLSPVQRGSTMAVPLRWEAAGPAGGLSPVLDADLILAADGEDRTRVALTGCYRPPLGRDQRRRARRCGSGRPQASPARRHERCCPPHARARRTGS
ncbi:MAG TPA: hypothetical protein DHU96_09990 [Actinobacteria bacterium]|nr:hypothetical protein [Actinomycetota bacterium]